MGDEGVQEQGRAGAERRGRRTMNQADLDVLRELGRALEAGEEVALVTVVGTEGAPPCRVGQKILVGAGRPLAGTLGCAELDTAAIAVALDALAGGEAGPARLVHPEGAAIAHVEPYRGRPRLVAVGATPVAVALRRLGALLDWQVIVFDPRDERTDRDTGDLPEVAAGPMDALVVTDHDLPGLPGLLAHLLAAEPSFVGVMGSRRHRHGHLEALETAGVPADAVAQIQTPVGLDIGGDTPAEIALSILAGVVAHRHGRPGGPLAPAPPSQRGAEPADGHDVVDPTSGSA